MTAVRTTDRDDVHQVAIAASFTAEPVEEVIGFWAAELSLPLTVSFAGYGQVFQELLDESGTMARNSRGVNVFLVRWADLVRAGAPGTADQGGGPDPVRAREVAGELAAAVREAAARWTVPVLVVVCPSGGQDTGSAMAEVDREFARRLSGLAGVHVVDPALLAHWYPGALATDAYTERLGHVPYTGTGFAALGSAIVRRLHRMLTPQPKVVVVDADHTLWDGVAGEGEVADIRIGPARRALQELLAEQRAAGRLLCLCSKNSPADTKAVLTGHPDMVLGEGDFTALRVDWRPKSHNIRELAEELGLGLDSFVFVDDSPVECAEVRDSLPQVAVLELPPDAEDAERFLRHSWILDVSGTTEEDTRRAAFYRTESERTRVQRAAPTLAGFLDSLQLRVDIAPATEQDIPRIAQLTQRTNQFNLSAVRRTEPEIRELLGGRDCLVVTAEDRFGSYGQVGVVIGGAAGAALRVDTFLLSCRALGRGVEHRVLAHVGALARDRGLETVELVHQATSRNQPAADFLRDVCGLPVGGPVHDGGHRLPADVAAAARYVPRELPAAVAEPDPAGQETVPAGADIGRALWALADRAGSRLGTAESIGDRVGAHRSPAPSTAEVTPGADSPSVEEAVAALMARVLGVDSVEEDENFFELGGTSIQLIGFMSGIRDRFGVELPTDTLYNSELSVRGVSASILLQTLAAPGEVRDVLALVESMTDEQIEAMLGSLDRDAAADTGQDRP